MDKDKQMIQGEGRDLRNYKVETETKPVRLQRVLDMAAIEDINADARHTIECLRKQREGLLEQAAATDEMITRAELLLQATAEPIAGVARGSRY